MFAVEQQLITYQVQVRQVLMALFEAVHKITIIFVIPLTRNRTFYVVMKKISSGLDTDFTEFLVDVFRMSVGF